MNAHVATALRVVHLVGAAVAAGALAGPACSGSTSGNVRHVDGDASAGGAAPSPEGGAPDATPSAGGAVRPPDASVPGCAFADSNLEARVREVLKLPSGPISAAAAGSLTELAADSLDIGSLQGIQCLPNLGGLTLIHNRVTDLAPLASLMKLATLRLDENRINSLAPLSGLTTLAVLTVASNPVTDLEPLRGLAALSSLDFAHAGVRSLEPVSRLPLTRLVARDNPLDGIAPLARILGLLEAELDATGLVDLAPLSGLTHLRRLNASDNLITDVGPLAAMPALATAFLTKNRVVDLAPLLASARASMELWVDQNPLSAASTGAVVPELCARGWVLHTDSGRCGSPPRP